MTRVELALADVGRTARQCVALEKAYGRAVDAVNDAKDAKRTADDARITAMAELFEAILEEEKSK